MTFSQSLTQTQLPLNVLQNNQRKAARTPEEAKILLAKKPKAPCHPVIAFAEQFWQQNETSRINT